MRFSSSSRGKTRRRAGILFFVALALGEYSSAANPAQERLTEVALLNRCYAHLTGRRIPQDHALLKAVSAGSQTALSACLSILDGTRLSSSAATLGRLVRDTPESRAVLRTFNDFHRTWFGADDLIAAVPTGEVRPRTRYLHDETESALHLTRALFAGEVGTPNGIAYSQVVTAAEPLEAIRSEGTTPSMARVQSLLQNGGVRDGTTRPLGALPVQIGELIGVRRMPDEKLSQTYAREGLDAAKLIHESLGGGILGTQSYLMLNLGRSDFQASDGGLRLNRRWSQSVFSDLLCRDLPVVRVTDALPYVQRVRGPATPSFRGSANCMACHSSIDPMAGTVRGAHYLEVPSNAPNNEDRFIQVALRKPQAGLAAATQVDADRNFSLRPADGRLYFRSYDGTLVQQDVRGVPQLGQALAQSSQLYACAAARYFAFFTGVGVNLGDIGDPAHPQPSPAELRYRALVIQLGEELKTHQSLRKLVESILRLEIYRRPSLRDFAEEVAP